MHNHFLTSAFTFILASVAGHLFAEEKQAWTFIENSEVKLGVKKSSGGAIGWFSLAGSDQNLVNHYDHGRLIQQSFYGGPDGSKWAKQDWVWNPVQEIPAVFVDRSLETLIIGQADGVQKLHPDFPNERYPTPKHWAAYVDRENFGLGVCVPQADVLTCYRVAKPGQKGACSYFAPLARFAIKPGMVFEYDCYLTIGSIEEIQSRFERLSKEK